MTFKDQIFFFTNQNKDMYLIDDEFYVNLFFSIESLFLIKKYYSYFFREWIKERNENILESMIDWLDESELYSILEEYPSINNQSFPVILIHLSLHIKVYFVYNASSLRWWNTFIITFSVCVYVIFAASYWSKIMFKEPLLRIQLTLL
jgi:hypothetical protein